MIYLLVRSNFAWLEAHHLGFLRVFNDVTFQSTIAVILSFSLVLALGPRVIKWLRRQKIGDQPEFDDAAVNKLMENKAATPDHGGHSD